MDEIIDELYYEAEDNLSMLDTIISTYKEYSDITENDDSLLERLQYVLNETDKLFLMM